MKASLHLAIVILSSCGSVELPREHYWRLHVPAAAPGSPSANSVLRVQDLQLGNALSGDCLVVADGPSHLATRDFDRWVAPLDRLVTDAVVQGLSRTGSFWLVKNAFDGGSEDCVLNGRVLDFCEYRTAGDAARSARAAFSFWAEKDGKVLFAEELRAEVTIEKAGPEGAVEALSQALQQVVAKLDARLQTELVLGETPHAKPLDGR